MHTTITSTLSGEWSDERKDEMLHTRQSTSHSAEDMEHENQNGNPYSSQPSEDSDATSIPACFGTGGDGWRGRGATSRVAYCNLKGIFYARPLSPAEKMEHAC